MYRILLVEDDPIITEVLLRQLKKWGYDAVCIEDFSQVMPQFLQYRPHLVLLDISLPFYNGYYWCEEIRKISSVPVIFLSSASDNMNLVMAINLGADDFLAKPFDLEVVTAKIQAALRRSYLFDGQKNQLEYRGVFLNLGDASLTYEDRRLELTKNEFKILQILLENRGRTVSRDAIMKRLWESDSFIDDNTLTVNITRLRKKLKEIGLPDLIVTKKGMGYLIGE